MMNLANLEARIERLKKRHGIDEKIAGTSNRTVRQVEEDLDPRIRRILSTLPASDFESKEDTGDE